MTLLSPPDNRSGQFLVVGMIGFDLNNGNCDALFRVLGTELQPSSIVSLVRLQFVFAGPVRWTLRKRLPDSQFLSLRYLATIAWRLGALCRFRVLMG